MKKPIAELTREEFDAAPLATYSDSESLCFLEREAALGLAYDAIVRSLGRFPFAEEYLGRFLDSFRVAMEFVPGETADEAMMRRAGLALKEIMERKLYREQYRTIDEYCESRWAMSKAVAYELASGVPPAKVPIPLELRWAVWERDDFTCCYCGTRQFLSTDHRIPESKGGKTTLENLATVCQSCNSQKRTKSHEAFLRIKQRQRESHEQGGNCGAVVGTGAA